jgi:hypothetical protein
MPSTTGAHRAQGICGGREICGGQLVRRRRRVCRVLPRAGAPTVERPGSFHAVQDTRLSARPPGVKVQHATGGHPQHACVVPRADSQPAAAPPAPLFAHRCDQGCTANRRTSAAAAAGALHASAPAAPAPPHGRRRGSPCLRPASHPRHTIPECYMLLENQSACQAAEMPRQCASNAPPVTVGVVARGDLWDGLKASVHILGGLCVHMHVRKHNYTPNTQMHTHTHTHTHMHTYTHTHTHRHKHIQSGILTLDNHARAAAAAALLILWGRQEHGYRVVARSHPCRCASGCTADPGQTTCALPGAPTGQGKRVERHHQAALARLRLDPRGDIGATRRSCHTRCLAPGAGRVLGPQPPKHVEVSTLRCRVARAVGPGARWGLGPHPPQHVEVSTLCCQVARPRGPGARRGLGPQPPQHVDVAALCCRAARLVIPWARRVLGPQPPQHFEVATLCCRAARPFVPGAWRVLVPQPPQHVEVAALCCRTARPLFLFPGPVLGPQPL